MIRNLLKCTVRGRYTNWAVKGAESKQAALFLTRSHGTNPETAKGDAKTESKRLAEFRKKLRETTSITDLGEQSEAAPKEDALPPWPENTNPHTGEVGGPRGPEPTRYGDWERKGRVSDF
ncbi:succinate dehydrogenase assembly factor 4, mitochondrial [Plutella xylostella]|uniref:succinate dehydrogenase assembly factor 4, mitochondrial n=1 Tax=Plutella xylostella TaxID=51655 RepID=UPI0020323FD9|nr:succinate dehydrogenase assembly factor 4, mitochondrial [Plutella xylostella]